MPLKHHTETAFMLFLGLMITLSGIIASILPPLPDGLLSWAVLFGLSLVYPLIFLPVLKSNRADYEFRLMHWFPAGIFLIWIVLEIFGPKFQFMHILELGFLFLWSWPLVTLGIAFLIIFSVHVIRRRSFRISVLALLLIVFTGGAILAEAQGYNPRLQAVLFEGQEKRFEKLKEKADEMVAFLKNKAVISSSAPSLAYSSFSTASSLQAPSSSVISSLSSSSSASVPRQLRKPRRLTQSGPETAGVMFVTLFGLYTSTLHKRAKNRI